MAGHNKLLLASMILALIMLLLTFTFNGLSSVGGNVYLNNTGSISDKYDIGITPAGWTFSIWGVIYFWQAAFMVYSFINIFRKTEDGYAYTSPVVLSPALFFVYALNLVLNIAWTFLFDRQELETGFACLFSIAFTLYICLFISYRKLAEHGPYLAKQGRTVEIWLTRIIVHNAFGIYATWTTIATLLNMTMVMIYRSDPGVEKETAGTVALGILTAEIVVFVVTDWFLLDKYSRYTFTPYIVVCVALGGSISKNWNPDMTNSIFSVVLLGIGCACAVVKVILLFWRHFKTPMYSSSVEPTSYNLKA